MGRDSLYDRLFEKRSGNGQLRVGGEMVMKKTFGLIVMVSLLVMSACSQAQSDEQGAASTIDQVLDKGKLVVGTAPGYYPFEMKDMNGEFVGYDIDVAKAIAEALDVEVEFQQFGFDGLIPALQTGEIDMILAGMTIRGDRALSVSFSDPYHTTGQVVMLPKDDTDTKSWEDLDQPNKKIAVSLGTTGALLAKQIFQEAEILDFEDFPSAAMALIQGEADGVVYDEPAIRVYEAMHSDSVRGIYDLISSEELGIAVRHNDLETVQWLNSFLASYLNSPEQIATYEKWFESSDWMDEVEIED